MWLIHQVTPWSQTCLTLILGKRSSIGNVLAFTCRIHPQDSAKQKMLCDRKFSETFNLQVWFSIQIKQHGFSQTTWYIFKRPRLTFSQLITPLISNSNGEVSDIDPLFTWTKYIKWKKPWRPVLLPSLWKVESQDKGTHLHFPVQPYRRGLKRVWSRHGEQVETSPCGKASIGTHVI